jgi:hypothetical protein
MASFQFPRTRRTQVSSTSPPLGSDPTSSAASIRVNYTPRLKLFLPHQLIAVARLGSDLSGGSRGGCCREMAEAVASTSGLAMAASTSATPGQVSPRLHLDPFLRCAGAGIAAPCLAALAGDSRVEAMYLVDLWDSSRGVGTVGCGFMCNRAAESRLGFGLS